MSNWQFTITDATAGDAEAMSRVIIKTLRSSNAEHYPPEVIEILESRFQPATIVDFLGTRKVIIAKHDDIIVGTGSLDVAGYVRSFFVDPDVQGKGVGRQLLARLLQLAKEEGFSRLSLRSSITAEGFYLTQGFLKIEELTDGLETTILMQKDLA